ncbi:Asp23/Gls24 family envelope stress response protein [Streptosporangium sp. NPDC051023]|uniref:Asp23/Gls24 family envelope stress response protein n=1 Tax=Streptosporangium sp. NPDC051023 TaxID=3155410 RepID=UPI00344EF176
MTDVSVEEITEETDSPAETAVAPRPFPLNLSATLPAPTPPVAPVAPAVTTVAEPVASAVVKGRIKVADEVVEKVAALATLEVTGVADLGEDPVDALGLVRERAASGPRHGRRGVSAHVQDRTVAVDVSIVAEYGHVVMDVANEVKNNVARTVSRMLGMRVVEVNVGVDDVRLPGEFAAETPVEEV